MYIVKIRVLVHSKRKVFLTSGGARPQAARALARGVSQKLWLTVAKTAL
jgi:hypothetical protein